MKKVYLAASLHSAKTRQRNVEIATALEELEVCQVLLPQRHGVFEKLAQEYMLHDRTLTFEQAISKTRDYCYLMDMADIKEADGCLIYCPMIPSEGACYELGGMSLQGKPCVIFCPSDEIYDELNLMITRAGPRAKTITEAADLLRKALEDLA